MSTYKDERGDTVSSVEAQKVVETTPVQARQGLLGRPVLMVLIGGLVLAIVAWAIVGMYGEAVDNDAATETEQTTTTDTKAVVTPTDQKVIDNRTMQTAPTDRDPTAESGTGGDSQSVAPTETETTQ